MFDKFEALMNKYLTPLANKMDKQVHLSAIKKINGCLNTITNHWQFLFDSRSYPKHDWCKTSCISLDLKES